MMNMAESAASAFLKPVFELLGSKIVTEFGLVWGAKEELDKFSSFLSAIQSVLQDAEEKQIHSNQVRDWMRKLKDVAYDAEDVLDEFATEALRSKLEKDENQTSKWKQVCNSFLSCLGLKSLYEHENRLLLKSLQFRREISHKIEDINEKLERIDKESKVLCLRVGDGDRDGRSWLPEVIRKKPETISLIHESVVLGRENDKEKLINRLVSDGSVSTELSVIPIVGMGGLGKTFLAQLIYNDEKVDEHFDLRGWVSVPGDFDLKRLSKAIIENISKRPSPCKELDSLVEEIKKIVRWRKFLLVLDDVWNVHASEWEKLTAPLKYGAKGSKIIVTTRSEKVSRIMGTIPHHSLKPLSDEDCWLLLGKWAFPATEGTWDEHRDLVAVGWEIAKKCRGLPLAVKTLGDVLQGTKQKTEWNDILRTEIWKLPQEGKYGILPALSLSYHHLPSHLKQCFLYCSIFPKDYEFDKEKLVKLWMAEGFITSGVGQRAMEDVGKDYFDDLLWRSFFQYEKDSFDGLTYKMHDLIHDLAQSLSEGECFRMEDNKLIHFSEKPRYSSCINHNENDLTNFELFLKCERLHTLLLQSWRAETISFPTNLFQQMKFLHVLDLNHTKITELPDSIGNLKHLRYLDLSYTDVQRLPESVSSLHNLQTLDLSGCYELVELPKDTRNLINLRHLILPEAHRISSTPKGIGGSTCLRTLSRFIVGKENGHEIGQLMKLINLRGRLRISGLENVVDAKEAILKNKEYIEELDLWWRCLEDEDDDAMDPSVAEEVLERRGDDDAMDPSVAEEVLGRLQPHQNLRILNISNYNGERFPSWIGDPSFSNLVDVTLRYCTSCQTLPPLWQLPSLRKLYLYGGGFTVNGIMVTTVVFPSLEKLTMVSFPNLVEWRGGTEEEDCFPCLGELQIRDCESLIALPRFLTSVRELCLYECNEGILSSLSYFTSLSSLKINCFKNLKVIPSGSFKNLKGLKDLTISDCKMLVSLVEEEEDCFPCLGELQIHDCESLIALPRFLTSVRELSLYECNERILSSLSYFTSLSSLKFNCFKNLKVIPSGSFKNLKALKDLTICDCKMLVSLVEDDEDCKHLHSLERLQIYYCPQLMVLLDEGLQYLVSLQRMSIWNLPELTFLPDGLKNLISLEELVISNCKRLATLPKEGLPTTLQTLSIRKCPLLAEQCKKESGEYWPKISYIPNLYTDFHLYSRKMFSLSAGASGSQQVAI